MVPWQSSSCLSPDSVIARSSGTGGNRVLCGFPTTLWGAFFNARLDSHEPNTSSARRGATPSPWSRGADRIMGVDCQ